MILDDFYFLKTNVGAEEETPKEASARLPWKWFLPHHGVVNPNKPGNVRVVFDAASEFRGTSLNKMLHRGPDYLSSQLGVLLCFRRDLVAISGDIRMMYHQVRVPKDQRAALSFIWRTPGDPAPPNVYRMTVHINVYRMTVHIFGAVSSPATCLYALRRTAEDNAVEFSDVAHRVLVSFYVDNWLNSFPTEAEAIRCWKRLAELLRRGGVRPCAMDLQLSRGDGQLRPGREDDANAGPGN